MTDTAAIALGIAALFALLFVGGAVVAAMTRDPYTRDYIVARLKHLHAIGDKGPEFLSLCDRLRHKDGVPYDGRVYFFRSILRGEPVGGGESEALRRGGLTALRAYQESSRP